MDVYPKHKFITGILNLKVKKTEDEPSSGRSVVRKWEKVDHVHCLVSEDCG